MFKANHLGDAVFGKCKQVKCSFTIFTQGLSVDFEKVVINNNTL